MSATGLDVFDTTLQKTNRWLKEIMEELGWKDRRNAYQALRATLHALRDRLPVEEVAHLGAQLPMLVRGIYYEGWDATDKPLKLRQDEAFLALVGMEFQGDDDADPDVIARAVLTVMSQHVSHGEIEDVKAALPQRVRELWP